ncbi:MAG: bifunctional proline dehydrogenase/L-glutamate gamma-semialdehyde dehydrogenase PutA [Thiofilum sp.]|uniref:bifunctional proline dehydrogenase/L-glutamate gamma-semialdehyde dehydrogenase PutA n=1 Tax=Thiofilum sp. TaxID=2212733 RepID=UPI0025D47CA9|nr:bifunctional proline dehydrogenase/L-glutamate gamma-semialdehyde dehydrogenase PutA [Thiofilum sp.]MBK8455535.1 bifunctional proline dehydrogenase/L-glutamate gamma-semialdehyde dehydrogenase PutA [Thiofilum sp.]
MSSVAPLSALAQARSAINAAWFRDETEVVQTRLTQHGLDPAARIRITERASQFVQTLRDDPNPNLMESFLAEYGLTTDEGVALMCLAEAYLRVPDAPTLDALIRDKIGGADWARHGVDSGSMLVNASTWALMLTGKIFRDEEATTGIASTLRKMIQRVGEPVVRTAVGQAMKVMGQQFVLGQTIEEAFKRGQDMIEKGYLHSFDMLGEAARTEADARRYFRAYSKAITAIAEQAHAPYVHDNPGISVKLSALHPRYESVNRERVMNELVPRVASLAEQARNANIGFNIDAEEADRLDLSLDVMEAVLRTPDFKGWEGFGIVVQAYAKHALPTLRWIKALASELKRKIAVRLVKGAYWDAEIKQAQVLGLPAYPVFTRKTSTDVSYLAGARFLLDNRDVIYPQFATHNAQTIAAILEMAGASQGFEFQRLHGMGEALHELVRTQTGRRTRIYAPVGVHEDLLAYLVRRLLENGANSSFVNQLLNEEVPVSTLVRDPIAVTEGLDSIPHPQIPFPLELFKAQGQPRLNSKGYNINQPLMAAELEQGMQTFATQRWAAAPLINGQAIEGQSHPTFNPAVPTDQVGSVTDASVENVELALQTTLQAYPSWRDTSVTQRAAILEAIADQYEAHLGELMALLSREAGKTRLDGVLEVREAVDFLRYYAHQAREQLAATQGRGVFVCISPWNFPLAIFTGQIAAALVSGNSVIAKPAEQTPLIAMLAVQLMLKAGLPAEVIALLPGDGTVVGAALTRDPRIGGVCFTGSTDTAILIDRAMAKAGNVAAPLIAETGGLNAMIVDSTALPEAAVRDIINSAFQSAGQRCSALRALFIQRDIKPKVLAMLAGATQELRVDNPWIPATDVGPVIDQEAKQTIIEHCAKFKAQGRVLFQHPIAETAQGLFVAPTAIELKHFAELEREIFGPVLHVIEFEASEIDQVVAQINASGYGLTMGLHTRLDDRIEDITRSAHVGNMYVNRNQIGAVVGVQPFGGEGLSGTGFKAGGEYYLQRFVQAHQTLDLKALSGNFPASATTVAPITPQVFASRAKVAQPLWDKAPQERIALFHTILDQLPKDCNARVRSTLDQALEAINTENQLPSPTGETNRLTLHGRGIALCLGGGEVSESTLVLQVLLALATGNAVAVPNTPFAQRLVGVLHQAGINKDLVAVVELGSEEASSIQSFPQLALVALEGDSITLLPIRQALAQRSGVRVQLVQLNEGWQRFCAERVVTIDTTASGGNASLLTMAA